jgi:solute carrier family 45 protein 1/2/4
VDVIPSRLSGFRIFFFIFSLLLTNVSINTLQGPSRAIVGDVMPKHQQQLGNMVASVMIGIAGVVGNLVGGLDLGNPNSWLTTQHLVFVIGAILVAIGAAVTIVTTPEEPLKERAERGNPFKELWNAARTLPGPILGVAVIYLISWMAYMPFQVEATDFFGVDIFHGDENNPNDKDYLDGCNFGMLVTAVANGVVLLYGFVHEPVVKRLGLKLTYALSQVLVAILLALVFSVTNKLSSRV